MNFEDAVRHALAREAERHPVNPTLERSTITRARVSRFATLFGTGVVVIAVALSAVALVGYLDRSDPRVGPASPSRNDETDTKRTAPLLLITEEGWEVARADEYGVKSGEISFTDGDQEIELFWRPAKTHEDYVQDREAGATQLDPIEVAGHDAILFQYDGTTSFTAMWRDEPLSLELRGGFETEDDFRAIAATLQFVDEETWLSAMPGGTITPEERATAVDEMLSDIPVHPKVDIEKLKTQHTISDRYQLGAQVTGAVVCAWIEQWIEATEDGRKVAAKEAEDAMASSREWSILLEMKKQGGWTDVVWEYADAMASDGNVAGGAVLSVEDGYASAFGCEGTQA